MGNSGQRSEQSRTVRINNHHSQHRAAVAIVVKAVFLAQLRLGFSTDGMADRWASRPHTGHLTFLFNRRELASLNYAYVVYRVSTQVRGLRFQHACITTTLVGKVSKRSAFLR